jgi:hypothetical protein
MAELLIKRLLEIDEAGERVRLRVETQEGERMIVVSGDTLVPIITGLASCSRALAHATGGMSVPTFPVADVDVKVNPQDQSARLALS